MKIYYDYQIFLHQKFGGISKYYINLINNLDSSAEKLIIAPFHKNYYLDNQNENIKKLIFLIQKQEESTLLVKI